MYVCLCKAVTDRQIRAAAEGGCNSMRDLQRELGVASCCGKCAPSAREILHDAIREQHFASPVPQPVRYQPASTSNAA